MEENMKFAKNKIISVNAAELFRYIVLFVLAFMFRKGVPIFITY